MALKNDIMGQAYGGELARAKLKVIAEHAGSISGPTELELPINPNKVTVSKEVNRGSDSPAVGSDTRQRQETGSEPRTVTLHDVIFDTYEERDDVRTKYIDTLEKFASVDKNLHQRPTLMLDWGAFKTTYESGGKLLVEISKFDVTYTMFLRDATPVRCRTTIVLKEVTDPKEKASEMQSPDHAKLHTVIRGDTLQALSFKEYDDPREWRRIADANNLDDPMQLEPGTKLLIPPILK